MSQPSPAPPSLPVDVVIGAATIPLLLGLVGVRLVSRAVVELGQASEEVFRGDRLPILNLSNEPSSTEPSQ